MDTADEIELIKGDYEALIREHGLSKSESVGWSDTNEQARRYQVLLSPSETTYDHGDLLEVGCGTGFIHRVPRLGVFKSYTGIDMIEEYVNAARVKYNLDNMRWIHDDAIPYLSNTNLKWDTVIASGVLAHYSGGLARTLLSRMWFVTKADGMMAFNWNRLTCGITDRDMLIILKDIGVESYVLRNDYRPNDYTVLAYK